MVTNALKTLYFIAISPLLLILLTALLIFMFLNAAHDAYQWMAN